MTPEQQRIKLRIEFGREKNVLFEDNIPMYADWLEKKLIDKEQNFVNSDSFKHTTIKS